MRCALGVNMIKIPWNSGNYCRSWHCALVVVRAAATAITHAEYVKQAWLQGEEGFPRPASPTCCFTRLLRGLAGGTVARGTAARGTTARRTALRRVVALAGKFRGCWASQRGLSKRLEANTTTLLTNRQKWLKFRLQLTKSFYLLSDTHRLKDVYTGKFLIRPLWWWAESVPLGWYRVKVFESLGMKMKS